MASNDPTDAGLDDPGSQRLKAILGLRGLIIEGSIPPGTRISEQMLAERLGISRTPARAALERVRDEGLLTTQSGGGFVVASFSESDILEAIDIRGTLEGTAARYAAERGVPPSLLRRLEDTIGKLDRVVTAPDAGNDASEYASLNDQFHELLLEAANSPMLRRSLDHIRALPFATPNAFVTTVRTDPQWFARHMIASQEQHRAIVEAIRQREGFRAEALGREHSRAAWRYLQVAMELPDADVHPRTLRFLRRRNE